MEPTTLTLGLDWFCSRWSFMSLRMRLVWATFRGSKANYSHWKVSSDRWRKFITHDVSTSARHRNFFGHCDQLVLQSSDWCNLPFINQQDHGCRSVSSNLAANLLTDATCRCIWVLCGTLLPRLDILHCLLSRDGRLVFGRGYPDIPNRLWNQGRRTITETEAGHVG